MDPPEFYRLRSKCGSRWQDYYAHEWDLIIVPRRYCECPEPYWKPFGDGTMYCGRCQRFRPTDSADSPP